MRGLSVSIGEELYQKRKIWYTKCMYMPILSTLIYVLSPDRKKVLLICRMKREDDLHFGKYNGLGGKLEAGEDLETGMQRELFEEAGIRATASFLKGTINWPGFGKNGEDWFGFVFLVSEYTGTLLSENDEGKLGWHDLDSLMNLPLWEGDYLFLPRVFDGTDRVFHEHMP